MWKKKRQDSEALGVLMIVHSQTNHGDSETGFRKETVYCVLNCSDKAQLKYSKWSLDSPK